jgi:hypothetical protein
MMESLTFVILVFVVIYLLTKNKFLGDVIKNNDVRFGILEDRYFRLERLLTINPKAMKNYKYDPGDEDDDDLTTPEGDPPPTPPGGGNGQ